jgi:NitT/TauT family transport system substrate-binding protein
MRTKNGDFPASVRQLGGLMGAVLLLASCSATATPTPPATAPATGSPAASASPAPTPTPVPKKLTVVMGIPFESANDIITVVLGQELGYFKDEGVDPNFQFTTGASTVQLLVAGQADIGFATVSDIALARSQGIAVKAFYNILTDNATAIAVLEESGITSADQLKGKTIGTATVGTGRYFDGRSMFKAAGLDPDADVKWVSVGIGAQALQALQSNQVQALVLWDAAYADMGNLGAKLRLFTFPFQKDLFSIVWEATDKFITDNHDAIVGFGRAEAKAELFARTNPDAAVRIFLKAHADLIPAGTSPEKAASDALSILKANLNDSNEMAGSPGIGGFAPTAWKTAVDYYTNLGLIKTPITDVTQLQIPDSLTQEMNKFDQAAIVTEAKNYPTQ